MGRRRTKPANPGVFGSNVVRARNAKGWSQEVLANRASLSRSTIAAVELGKYGSSDMSTIEKIATALEVPLDEMIRAQPESGPSATMVEEFLRSVWVDEIKPTDEEIEWLRSLPTVTWGGLNPSASTVAKLVLWLREGGR